MLLRALAYTLAYGPGIRQATEDAVLNANYIRKNLEDSFDLPYDLPSMHEVVFSDARQKKHGVNTMDIAKRLIDYGFHPYTTAFPLIVPGAMMIEPTESESKEECDLFIEAMRSIALEAETNPEMVKTAPHSTRVGRLDEVAAARKPSCAGNLSRQMNASHDGRTSRLPREHLLARGAQGVAGYETRPGRGSCRTIASIARPRIHAARSSWPGISASVDVWFLDGFLKGSFEMEDDDSIPADFKDSDDLVAWYDENFLPKSRKSRGLARTFGPRLLRILRNLQFSRRDVPAIHAVPHDSAPRPAHRVPSAHGRQSAKYLWRQFRRTHGRSSQ